jgi:hypothetical protein
MGARPSPGDPAARPSPTGAVSGAAPAGYGASASRAAPTGSLAPTGYGAPTGNGALASPAASATAAGPAGQAGPGDRGNLAGRMSLEGPGAPGAGGKHAVRLRVELVPKTSWYGDLRELVDEETWDRISRQVARRAGDRCEICGGGDPGDHPVECHEVWRYDDRVRLQTLLRIVALCPDCHTVEHMGFANMHGGGTAARAHLARVNGWTLVQTDAHIAMAFRVWAQRNQGPWILDLEGLRPYLPVAEYARVARRAAIPPPTDPERWRQGQP